MNCRRLAKKRRTSLCVFGFTVEKYKEYFKNFAVFNGKTSDTLYYKVFFDIDKRVIDVTNAIIIASDGTINPDVFQNPKATSEIQKIGVDIKPYADDLHKIYSV